MKVFVERISDKGYITLRFGVLHDDGHREYTVNGRCITGHTSCSAYSELFATSENDKFYDVKFYYGKYNTTFSFAGDLYKMDSKALQHEIQSRIHMVKEWIDHVKSVDKYDSYELQFDV